MFTFLLLVTIALSTVVFIAATVKFDVCVATMLTMFTFAFLAFSGALVSVLHDANVEENARIELVEKLGIEPMSQEEVLECTYVQFTRLVRVGDKYYRPTTTTTTNNNNSVQ